ncbi:prostaglandin-H2 D-isomerase-like [Heterodontus francisci]|uniref:prostaglandin-H2 D-isomerase-like n=1 Tax=Heterodontus francisci TaxID=7792 RepID=UPI00355B76A5
MSIRPEKMSRCLVLLLAALSLGTGAAVSLMPTNNVQVQENLDVNQTLGPWFSIGSAGDSFWFETVMGSTQMTKFVLSPTEEKNKFNVLLLCQWNGTCANMTEQIQYLGRQGRFKYISPPDSGIEIGIQIVHIKYNEYAILIYDSQMQGRKTKSVALYGRTRKMRKEIHEQFQEFVLKQGIPEDMIMFLPEQGECISWRANLDIFFQDLALTGIASGTEDLMNATPC